MYWRHYVIMTGKVYASLKLTNYKPPRGTNVLKMHILEPFLNVLAPLCYNDGKFFLFVVIIIFITFFFKCYFLFFLSTFRFLFFCFFYFFFITINYFFFVFVLYFKTELKNPRDALIFLNNIVKLIIFEKY